MNKLVASLGFWASTIMVLLVLAIDVGMIASAILFPVTSITNIESYAQIFTSAQMLPFIPSLMLGPVFIIMTLCIHHYASEEEKILTQLGVLFAVVCATILSLHYYIQLTVVQQGLLNNELSGLWLFVTPNPHSFFWAFAALGYGFMGFALLAVAPIFKRGIERAIKWLFITIGIIGIAFIIGNALGIFMVNILASFIWGVLFPIASLLMAIRFRALKS